MFVTTFYSYKGGVGRTMALANVASELSRRGETVLVADFDLELRDYRASLSMRTNRRPTKCRVWWTSSSLAGIRARARIREFVCKHTDDDPSHGPIFVMPAGKMDDAYGSRLHQIDFDLLYRDLDGYLLFEDIRAQWERLLKVDYVLINSRTGHTDIGGICTRQLPDLIAFVFWPNIQNLNGLKSIIQRD